MKRALESIAIIALLSVGLTSSIRASDHGTMGQTFAIIEPDLLATIEGRLKKLQATGEIDRMNQMFRQRAEAKIRRPTPVPGISAATLARVWNYDPTISVDHDVHDPKGNLIARAGQSVNPLDFVTMHQALVFVNGDSKEEMAWATQRYTDLKAKIILVNGSPIEEMTNRQRRFYFDQEGRLTRQFGVRHTPTTVEQNGRVLRLTEVVMKGAS